MMRVGSISSPSCMNWVIPNPICFMLEAQEVSRAFPRTF